MWPSYAQSAQLVAFDAEGINSEDATELNNARDFWMNIRQQAVLATTPAPPTTTMTSQEDVSTTTQGIPSTTTSQGNPSTTTQGDPSTTTQESEETPADSTPSETTTVGGPTAAGAQGKNAQLFNHLLPFN